MYAIILIEKQKRKESYMTRKDFQAIATVIKDTPFTDAQDRVILAHRMAEVCYSTNPNFNKQRFLDACKAPAVLVEDGKLQRFIEARDLTPAEATELWR